MTCNNNIALLTKCRPFPPAKSILCIKKGFEKKFLRALQSGYEKRIQRFIKSGTVYTEPPLTGGKVSVAIVTDDNYAYITE